VTLNELATRFAVKYTTIQHIVTGRTYKTAGGPVRLARHRLAPGTPLPEVRKVAMDILYGDAELQPNGCLHWTGRLNDNGYGYINIATVPYLVHRLAYELLVGPIANELVIDHGCHSVDATCGGGRLDPHRRCIRPDHLAAIERRINSRLGRAGIRNKEKTHCPRGHPYAGSNLYSYKIRKTGTIGRGCRECRTQQARMSRVRKPSPPAGSLAAA